MKKLFFFLLPLLLLTGCGAKPAPLWISSGHKQLESFKQDFLTGRDSSITESHFRKAVEEIKKGGDADLLGKAWLTRMALQVAIREELEEGEYLKIESVEPVPANRNFYLLLKGDTGQVDGSLLPEATVWRMTPSSGRPSKPLPGTVGREPCLPGSNGCNPTTKRPGMLKMPPPSAPASI